MVDLSVSCFPVAAVPDLCCVAAPATPLHPTQGTPTHMAPEQLLRGHISKASDVYAYGILLWELLTGQRPFAGVPLLLLPHEVAREGLRPAWPPGLPDNAGYAALRRLAEDCWVAEPGKRWVGGFGGRLGGTHRVARAKRVWCGYVDLGKSRLGKD